MSHDIHAVMITIDRSPSPNFLSETMENLRRSDLATSYRLERLTVVDSGTSIEWAIPAVIPSQRVRMVGAPTPRCANLNVATALRMGQTGMPWILFLEDDIDVCANFFDSVGAWLDDHAREDRRVYSFGANYGDVKEIARAGGTSWNYPIRMFYGTQAFAIRSSDAVDLADHLEANPEHCGDGTGYDLLMHGWSKARWPDVKHYLASVPSFVQHIGMSSVIRPRKIIHTFPSWPGRGWSYRQADRQEEKVV